MTHEAHVIFYSLSDYNNGDLVAHKFDLTQYDNRNELETAVAEWLKEITTPEHLREEWILADFEGIPSACAWEYGIHDSAFIFLKAVKKHGLEVAEAAQELGILDSTETVEDCYVGKFDSLSDFVKTTLEENGQLNWVQDSAIPQWLQGYIDYEAMGRDWMIDSYHQTNGHYFRSV